MAIGLSGDRDNELLELFCHHLVGLTWYEGTADSNGEYVKPPTPFLGSGFVIQIGEDFWLATAGHIFKDHDKRMAKPAAKYSTPFLFDYWSPESTVPDPLRYDFFDDSTSLAFVSYSETEGLDFALIQMPELIGKALSKTIKPFRRIDWVEGAKTKFDFHAVLGIPIARAQVTCTSKDGKTTTKTAPIPELIFLDEVEWPHPKIEKTEQPQFVAKLHERSDISTVEGMSGGPILGFKREGSQIRYYPVAIQSRWNPKRRIVVGCPLDLVGNRFETFIETMESEFDGSDEETETCPAPDSYNSPPS